MFQLCSLAVASRNLLPLVTIETTTAGDQVGLQAHIGHLQWESRRDTDPHLEDIQAVVEEAPVEVTVETVEVEAGHHTGDRSHGQGQGPPEGVGRAHTLPALGQGALPGDAQAATTAVATETTRPAVPEVVVLAVVDAVQATNRPTAIAIGAAAEVVMIVATGARWTKGSRKLFQGDNGLSKCQKVKAVGG